MTVKLKTVAATPSVYSIGLSDLTPHPIPTEIWAIFFPQVGNWDYVNTTSLLSLGAFVIQAFHLKLRYRRQVIRGDIYLHHFFGISLLNDTFTRP